MPESALGWTYEEHYKITLKAFDVACSSEATNRHYVCTSLRIRKCYAHMVAIAGDYVERPSDLIDARSGLLHRDKHGVDCRDLAMNSKRDGADGNFDAVNSLAATGWRGLWGYLRLLPDNRSHFQPNAPGRWEGYLREALAPGKHELPSVLAKHAFSSHFLQDSFAAGHNGIDRGQRKQDYDHAYHDDFNSTGQFLKNGNGDEWHSYGDKGLLDPSLYLLQDYCAGEEKLTQLQGDLEELLDDKFLDFSERVMQVLCVTDDLAVLTLSQGRWSIWNPCFYWDNCQKTEVIYAATPAAAPFLAECGAHNDTPLVTCHSTSRYVVKAMRRQIELLVWHLEGEVGGISQKKERISAIRKIVPAEYRTVKYKEGSELFINKQSFLLSYSDWKDLGDKDNYQRLSFRNWAASIHWTESDVETLDDTTLTWSLMAKAADATEVSALPHWIRDRGQLEMRYDVVSDNGNLLDGFAINLGLEIVRPFDRVFGVTVTAGGGIDDVWGGKVDRNWYYGGGLELNMHVGKNIVFLNVESLSHNGSGFDHERSLRAHLGWRVASVALSR